MMWPAPVGFWDPLGLSADGDVETFKRRRAAELKHGRICMLACVGYIVPEYFRWPGYLSPEKGLKFADMPHGIAAISKGYFWRQDPKRAPGDYEGYGFLGAGKNFIFNFDPIEFQDPQVKKTKLAAELANGRLAMVALMAMLFQNGTVGTTGPAMWLEALAENLAGLSNDVRLPPRLPSKIEGIPEQVPLDYMKPPASLRMRGTEASATEKLFGPLPVRLSLKLPSNQSMVMVQTTGKEDVWFRSGWTMRDPKVHVAVGLRKMQAKLQPEATALDSVRLRIYEKLLNEVMAPKLYDLTVAGSTYAVSLGNGGMTLDFVGFQGALPTLIDKALDSFNSFNQGLNATKRSRFERIKNTYMEELQTFGGMPSSYAIQDLDRLLSRNSFSNDESLAAVKGLSLDAAVRTAGELVLSKPLSMTALAIGNLADLQSTEVLSQIVSSVQRPSWVSPKPVPKNATVEEVMPVVNIKRPIEVRAANPRHGDPNDVAVVSLIHGVTDVPSRVILGIASALLGTAAFDNLRTQQQLGPDAQAHCGESLVGGGMSTISNVNLVRVVVQGTKVDAYRQQLLEPPLAASDEVTHFWAHITQGGRCMDLLDQVLQFLDSPACSKQLLLDTWNNLVFGKSDKGDKSMLRKKITATWLKVLVVKAIRSVHPHRRPRETVTAMVEVEEPQDYLDVFQSQRGGFSFENCKRNAYLAAQANIKPPTAMKSGTTICGIQLKDAVILAADTRATEGPMVADKNCEKLHYISKNVFCAGAGTAADLQCHGRYIGCALVLGGVDVTGPHLYQIYPHGSTDKLPFTTMGSGSLAAMAIMEAEYNENLSIEDGKKLVAKAIRAGIFNDLGSGGNVDVCVITKETGGAILRNYEKPNERKFKAQHAAFPKGTTPILKEEPNDSHGLGDEAPTRLSLEQAQKLWQKHGVAPDGMKILAEEFGDTRLVSKSNSKVRQELIKDGQRGGAGPGPDEHHGNQVYCTVEQGTLEVVRASALASGILWNPLLIGVLGVQHVAVDQKFFVVTLPADDPMEMCARGKHVLQTFGPWAPYCGFQLSGPLSLGTLTAVRRAFPAQFLHYHAGGELRAFSAGGGQQNDGRRRRRGCSAWVHAKLARILGASSMLIPAEAEATTPGQDFEERVRLLTEDRVEGPSFEQLWEGMKPVLPAISGKMHALRLPFLFERAVGDLGGLCLKAGSGPSTRRVLAACC
eukprot:g24242.t1